MKKVIRSNLKKVPGLVPLVRSARNLRRKMQTTEQIFDQIALKRTWVVRQSISGPGSDHEETKNISIKLPILLKDLKVHSLLDIPCGDFNWMKLLDLDNIYYVGADIVSHLVEQNMKYQNDNKRFVQLDLIIDPLPRADLVLVRDCLVHFSYQDIEKALKNLRRSESTYLLTTTFTDVASNTDIATGGWRVLNLERSPFNFPPPIKVINEKHRNKDYADKSLGLWRLSDIPV